MERWCTWSFWILCALLCTSCSHNPSLPGKDSLQKVLVSLHLQKSPAKPGASVCILNLAAMVPEQPIPAVSDIPKESPSVQILETSHDFGELKEDGDYSHDFKLKNVGSAVLQIKKVIPG